MTVIGASSSSPIRSQALAVSCAKANRKPSDRIGHSSTVNSATKPTSPPTVSAPVFTATRAADQDHRERHLRVELEDAPQQRQGADLVQLQAAAAAAALRVVAVEHQPAAAERLDHPDALHGLLDVGGQLALLVLHPPRLDVVAPLPAQRRATDSGTVVSSTARPSGQ